METITLVVMGLLVGVAIGGIFYVIQSRKNDE